MPTAVLVDGGFFQNGRSIIVITSGILKNEGEARRPYLLY